ncbi:MAG TPA: hypothetical protein VII82_10940, partial [Polyangiaceae bacterium]
MDADSASQVVKEIAPRIVAAVRGRVRAVGIAPGARADGDYDVLVLVDTTPSQRLRLGLCGGGACNVLVETEESIAQAIARGIRDHVVRLTAAVSIAFDDEGALIASRERAVQALRFPRPENPSTTLRAMSEPADLLNQIELSADNLVVSQLLYGELLVALQRARLTAASCWDVPPGELFDAVRRIDAPLAAWIAISSRRPFAPALLPAIRTRVQS